MYNIYIFGSNLKQSPNSKRISDGHCAAPPLGLVAAHAPGDSRGSLGQSLSPAVVLEMTLALPVGQ